MAIPEDRLSTTNAPDAFLAPRDVVVLNTRSLHFGGVALNNPSAGLLVQVWQLDLLNDREFWLQAPNTPAFLLFSVPGVVTEVSLAFDANMEPVVAFVEDGVAKLRWFDVVANAQVITSFAGNVSPRVVLDDPRRLPLQFGNADVIFAYMRAGVLHHRRQRDRYQVEFTLGQQQGIALRRIGMNKGNRLQFEVTG